MGLRNTTKKLFAEDPEKAVAFIRANLGGRQRRVVTLLDGLLEETDRLIVRDPKRAVLVSETALGLTSAATSTRWIRARAYGVLGSAYGMVQRSQEAMRLFARGWEVGSDSFEAGALLMRRSVVQCHLFQWRQAVRTANRGVRHFTEHKIPRETEFCSLPMALIVRAKVMLEAFGCAPGLGVSLFKVIQDCTRGLELIGHRKNFSSIALYSLLTKGAAVSALGLTGVPVEESELEAALEQTRETQAQLPALGLSRRTLHWAYSLWLEGQLEALIAERLTVEAERLLRASRELLMENEALGAAISLTLEYQWWLLKSGRGVQAIQEAEFLEEHAGKVGDEERALREWVAALKARRIAPGLAMVFRDVRGIRDVRPPKPAIRRRTAMW